MNRTGFTMIELVFVIVVIGILAAIAVPKFAATRDDAVITKARATVGSLRSALSMERQKRILRGNASEDINISTAVGLLQYGLDSDRWTINDNNDSLTFTAPSGNHCEFDLNTTSYTLNRGSCSVSGLNDL